MLRRKKPLKRTPIKKTPWDNAKKEQEKKKAKAGLSKPALIKKLDTIFSEFIRLRDTEPWDFQYGRCISCGRILPWAKLQCGHYHSRVHLNTRFDEKNCNAECVSCNIFSADHLIGYRKNLIKKIGEREVDLLDIRAHQSKNYSLFELQTLIDYYKKKVQQLKKGNRYDERK